MVYLFIDTKDSKNITAKLEVEGQVYSENSTDEDNRPESILLLIDKLLTKAGKEKGDIDEIKVEEGPGSYTGLKVGASVASALSFSLGKRVNGKPLGEIVEPTYQ